MLECIIKDEEKTVGNGTLALQKGDENAVTGTCK